MLWASHSSESVKRIKCLACPTSSSSPLRSDGTLHMRRPAGESTAPSGPFSSWKSSAEPSGSDAANWKTKFSPANVRRLIWGWWKDGGSLSKKTDGTMWETDCSVIIFQSSDDAILTTFLFTVLHLQVFDDSRFLFCNKHFISDHGQNNPQGYFWKDRKPKCPCLEGFLACLSNCN